MNTRNNYGFQQLIELCKQTHHVNPHTKCVEGTNRSDFLPNFLKEAKSTPDFQAYAYYLRFTGDKISHQSTDQFPKSYINPVEFDGTRMQAEFLDFKLKREETR